MRVYFELPANHMIGPSKPVFFSGAEIFIFFMLYTNFIIIRERTQTLSHRAINKLEMCGLQLVVTLTTMSGKKQLINEAWVLLI